MKNILITGVLGHIGSNITRKVSFNKMPFKTIGIDNVTDPLSKRNIYFNKNTATHFIDVGDEHFLDLIFDLEKPNYVIHLANGYGNELNNIDNLINASKKYSIECLIYIGNSQDTYITATCSRKLNDSGINHYTLIPGDIYGPRQSLKNLIPQIIKSFLYKTDVVLGNGGSCLRDWTFVEDVISAIFKILEIQPSNRNLNVRSNYVISDLELANHICNIMNGDFNLLKFVELAEVTAPIVSVSSDLSDIGWAPTPGFKKNLGRTVDWYVNNSWFLK